MKFIKELPSDMSTPVVDGDGNTTGEEKRRIYQIQTTDGQTINVIYTDTEMTMAIQNPAYPESQEMAKVIFKATRPKATPESKATG